ncbi:hypothetical protein AHF37_03261 [Paragonimus kellicotti]|nr:hypothetical protein AHF37_03261 [Paragonimus kellicotti]
MSRSINYRIRRTEEVKQCQNDALSATIFLLKEFGPTSFLLQDENQRKFRVHIGEEHTCSCSTFKASRELCTHIFWIMLKRFKVHIDDPVGWQLGLVEREVMDVLEGKHSRVNTKKLRQSGEKSSDEQAEQHGQLKQRKIEADDVCCICQEELLSENRYPVTYCRKGCGNSVHIRCMRVWTDHQRKQKTIADLARLPHWTIRVPRMSRVGAACDRQLSSSISQRAKRGVSARSDEFDSELQAIADLGRMNGSQARLDKWGSLKTTGLLAPGRQCRLCLMTYQIGETVRRLDPGCQHIFHTTCIDPWLLHRSATCPLDGFKVTPLSGVVRQGSLQVSYVTPNTKSNVPDLEGAHFHISAFGLKTPKPAPKAQLLTSPRRKAEENNINNFSAPSGGLSIVGQTILTVCAANPSASGRRLRNRTDTPPHSTLNLTHDWFAVP